MFACVCNHTLPNVRPHVHVRLFFAPFFRLFCFVGGSKAGIKTWNHAGSALNTRYVDLWLNNILFHFNVIQRVTVTFLWIICKIGNYRKSIKIINQSINQSNVSGGKKDHSWGKQRGSILVEIKDEIRSNISKLNSLNIEKNGLEILNKII